MTGRKQEQRRPSLTSLNIVDGGEGAAEEDGEFGVMKANGSDRWEERWHSSGERLAHSPARQRDVWRQNVNVKGNDRIQRGIIKWDCSCYANTGVHRRIPTLPSLGFPT